MIIFSYCNVYILKPQSKPVYNFHFIAVYGGVKSIFSLFCAHILLNCPNEFRWWNFTWRACFTLCAYSLVGWLYSKCTPVIFDSQWCESHLSTSVEG